MCIFLTVPCGHPEKIKNRLNWINRFFVNEMLCFFSHPDRMVCRKQLQGSKLEFFPQGIYIIKLFPRKKFHFFLYFFTAVGKPVFIYRHIFLTV
jgi:hypothetical protein